MIGLELGSVWRRLGAEVTVVEYLDRILPGMDGEVAKQFQRMLAEAGLRRSSSATKVTGVRRTARGLPRSRSSPRPAATAETLDADVVLVAIGRVPYTDGLGLDEVGVKLDDRGRIEVDEHFRTSVAGHLRHRRRDRRPDARPQGRGRGRRRRRDPRRPGRPRELRRHPRRRLHRPRGRHASARPRRS